METLEERAKEYAGVSTNPHAMYDENYVLATRYASYKEGATEQKAIDDKECETMVGIAVKEAKQVFIEKACEWLKSQADECFVSGDSVGEHLVFKDLNLAEFLKALEE